MCIICTCMPAIQCSNKFTNRQSHSLQAFHHNIKFIFELFIRFVRNTVGHRRITAAVPCNDVHFVWTFQTKIEVCILCDAIKISPESKIDRKIISIFLCWSRSIFHGSLKNAYVKSFEIKFYSQIGMYALRELRVCVCVFVLRKANINLTCRYTVQST